MSNYTQPCDGPDCTAYLDGATIPYCSLNCAWKEIVQMAIEDAESEAHAIRQAQRIRELEAEIASMKEQFR